MRTSLVSAIFIAGREPWPADFPESSPELRQRRRADAGNPGKKPRRRRQQGQYVTHLFLSPRSLEAVTDRRERRFEAAADQRRARDDRNRDQSGDEAVFDCRGAGLVTPQKLQEPYHQFSPSGWQRQF